MVGILIAAVIGALTFAGCVAMNLPVVVGIVCAVIASAASLPMIGARFGLRDY
jgi:hypothetical protein